LNLPLKFGSIIGPEGFERVSKSPKKKHNQNKSAAKSAAIPADLAKIQAAWPKLPKAIRRAILALIESA
jgi:hypothetical protein